MNQPGGSDLFDVVHQHVQQPLNANIRPTSHLESPHALGGGDVGEYRLHDTHAPGVHSPAPFGVDALTHLLGIGPGWTVTAEESTPGCSTDQTAGGEIACTAV